MKSPETVAVVLRHWTDYDTSEDEAIVAFRLPMHAMRFIQLANTWRQELLETLAKHHLDSFEYDAVMRPEGTYAWVDDVTKAEIERLIAAGELPGPSPYDPNVDYDRLHNIEYGWEEVPLDPPDTLALL